MDNFRTLTETRQVAADLTHYSTFARGLIYGFGIVGGMWLLLALTIVVVG